MTERQAPPLSTARTRRWTIAAVILMGAAGAVYGIGRIERNPGDAACRPAVEVARRIAPLVHGEVAAVAVAETPFRVPDITFSDAAGTPHRLSEWRGRTVLLNLWATWCVPCRKEMPALDALQSEVGGERFEVVAVNIDTRDLDKPRTWLQTAGVTRLAYYGDPSAKVFQDLKLVGKAFGMPTTLLIDPAGCEIGTIAGPADWASPDGVTLVKAVLEP